jgi:alkaline phosphatase D
MRFSLFAAFALLPLSAIFSQKLYDEALDSTLATATMPFPFGVASGDPGPHGVVLWTKIMTENPDPQEVSWQIAADTLMKNIVQMGTVKTDTASAFTVKVNAERLSPGTIYFYRFQYGGAFSPIGRTKTAPEGDVSLLKLAVTSCSNYPSGQYNAYGHLARRTDLDAILHLGDYIYEYGNWRNGRKRMMKSLRRVHIPDRECTRLPDYRTRYAQYRLDRQLQECHRLHPFIVIWDDHETANDANAAGSQNHQGGEGNWEARKAVARQAYFEWLPIRDNPERSIIRQFSFGKLANLWMLDERLEARSPQAKGLDDPSLHSPARHMLGEEQTRWLLNGMAASEATWKIIGNQVIFSPLHDSKVFSRRPQIRMDRWDGYPAERRRIFDFIYENNLKNIVVVTGDVHSSWAFELTADPLDKNAYDRKTGKGVVGAEFVSPSVTSMNFDEIVPKFITWEAKRRFCKKKNNPHLRYLDLNRHGYLLMTLTPQRAQAEWWFVDNLDKADGKCKRKASRYLPVNGTQILK